jgi:hypothetical protein
MDEVWSVCRFLLASICMRNARSLDQEKSSPKKLSHRCARLIGKFMELGSLESTSHARLASSAEFAVIAQFKALEPRSSLVGGVDSFASPARLHKSQKGSEWT